MAHQSRLLGALEMQICFHRTEGPTVDVSIGRRHLQQGHPQYTYIQHLQQGHAQIGKFDALEGQPWPGKLTESHWIHKNNNKNNYQYKFKYKFEYKFKHKFKNKFEYKYKYKYTYMCKINETYKSFKWQP